MATPISTKKLHICDICNYKTNRKGNYARHLQSKIHLNNSNLPTIDKLSCPTCNITLGSRSTLWRHSKICRKKASIEEVLRENIKLTKIVEEKDNQIKEKDKHIGVLTNLLGTITEVARKNAGYLKTAMEN